MRTKNPAEEFGVAQYSDGRTGWEPARRPGRAGGRGFNGAVPVRPATSAGHPVPPGTSSCRPPGATAAGATLMYLHDTRSPRWSPQHKTILFTTAATTWTASNAAGLSRLQHVEAKMLPGSNVNLLEKSYLKDRNDLGNMSTLSK